MRERERENKTKIEPVVHFIFGIIFETRKRKSRFTHAKHILYVIQKENITMILRTWEKRQFSENNM